MKIAIVLLNIFCLGLSAPQTKASFNDNLQEFIDLIAVESGHDLEHLVEHYVEFDDFLAGLDYLKTNNLKENVAKLESVPEFHDVQHFLEHQDIDILYLIDQFYHIIEHIEIAAKKSRHEISGTTVNAFITDAIAEFPKDKLRALYDLKMTEDEEFKATMDKFSSHEWHDLQHALFENEAFLNEVAAFDANGISILSVLNQFTAIFGQN